MGVYTLFLTPSLVLAHARAHTHNTHTLSLSFSRTLSLSRSRHHSVSFSLSVSLYLSQSLPLVLWTSLSLIHTCMLQLTASRFNSPQRLKRTATPCNERFLYRRYTRVFCNSLQHITTHCNDCNALQLKGTIVIRVPWTPLSSTYMCILHHCNPLQRTATHCNSQAR